MADSLGINFNAAALESMGLSGFMEMLGKATGGNVEVMAQLFGSTEALNAVLALTGSQAGTFNQKLDAMKNSSGAMQAAFEEQSKSFNHQWQLMTNSLDALKITVGNELLPIISKKVQAVAQLTGRLTEAHPALGKVVAVALLLTAALGLTVGPMLMILARLPAWIAGYNALATSKTLLAAKTKIVAVATAAWNAVLTANPIGLVIVAIGALVAALVFLYKKNETVRYYIDQAWNGIKIGVGSAIDFILAKLQGLVKFIPGLADKIQGYRDSISNVVDNARVDKSFRQWSRTHQSMADLRKAEATESVKREQTAADDIVNVNDSMFSQIGSLREKDTAKAKEEAEKKKQQQIKEVDRLYDGVRSALKKHYEEARRLQEDALKSEVDSTRRAADEKIKELERVYNAQLKLVDAEEIGRAHV